MRLPVFLQVYYIISLTKSVNSFVVTFDTFKAEVEAKEWQYFNVIFLYRGNWVVFFQVGFSTLLSGDRVATWFKAFQRLLNEDLRETSDRSLGADIFGTWAVNYFHVFFFGTTLIGLMIHHDLCGNSHVLFEKHVCICDIRDHKERCFFFFRENASNLSDVRGGLAGGSKIPMRLTWLLSHRSCSPVGHGEGREAEWPSANLLQVILVWTEGT